MSHIKRKEIGDGLLKIKEQAYFSKFTRSSPNLIPNQHDFRDYSSIDSIENTADKMDLKLLSLMDVEFDVCWDFIGFG